MLTTNRLRQALTPPRPWYQDFPGEYRRHEALHEMAELVVVVALPAEYRLEVIEQGTSA